MKKPSALVKVRAFTLSELLMTILLLAVIAVVVLQFRYKGDKGQSYVVTCLSHQRQIATELTLWKEDHKSQFPWQVPSLNGGSLEYVTEGNAAAVFKPVSNSAPGTVSMFFCPTDRKRLSALNYADLNNQNVSYFIGLDAGPDAAANILTGDRHLESSRKAVKSGLFVYSNNTVMGWTRELHGGSATPLGVMAFYDGHAQTVQGKNVDSVFQKEGLQAKRLVVP